MQIVGSQAVGLVLAQSRLGNRAIVAGAGAIARRGGTGPTAQPERSGLTVDRHFAAE